MGVIASVSDRIRKTFSKDKERRAIELSKGQANPVPGSNYGLLDAYGYETVSEYLKLEHDLLGRFRDYEDMDDYPEIATAMDVFADDATQPDTTTNRTIWISSQDRSLQDNLNDLTHNTLRMDEEAWEIARALVKYGNDYEEALVTKEGVVGLNFLPQATMRRIEGPRGDLRGFVQDFKGKFGYDPREFERILAARMAGQQTEDDRLTALEDWEVVHFRLRGKHRRSVYGYSVLEPARWIYKRLTLLEDAALIYRLQRAPERYAFYIDVGDLPPNEALGFVNRMRQQFRKKKFVNPSTGKLDLKTDALAQDEDFWVPSRKGTDSTRIETVGSPQWQHMEDIEYFRDKMFAAIKIPKAYLGQEDGAVRNVLSSMDVRFARTVMRIQREVKNGYRKVCRVHLAALGINPYDVSYDINMTVPSSILELAQLEVRNARADLAGRMREHVSLYWVLSKVYGIPDEDIKLIIKQRGEDAQRDMMQQMGAESSAQSRFGPPPEEFGSGETRTPGAGGEEGGEEEPNPEAEQESLRQIRLLRKQLLAHKPVRGISERELLEGSRQAERRAEAKYEQLLRNDLKLTSRLQEVGALLQDLRATVRSR